MKTYLLPVLLMAYLGARVANASIAIVYDYNLYSNLGCYQGYEDVAWHQVLDGGHMESADHMTVEYCIGLCGGAVSPQ